MWFDPHKLLARARFQDFTSTDFSSSDPFSSDPFSSSFDPFTSDPFSSAGGSSLDALAAQNAMFGQFDPASMQDPSSAQAIDYTQATQQPISGDPTGQLQDFGGGQQQPGQQAPQGQQPGQQQPGQQQDSALLNWLRQGAGQASDPWQLGAGGQNPELAQPYRTASLTMMPPPGEANFQQRSGEFQRNPNFPSQNLPNPQNLPATTQINPDPNQQTVSGQIPVQQAAPQQPQQPVPGTDPRAPGTPEQQQGQPQDPYRRQRQPRSPVEQMIQGIIRQLMAGRARFPGRYPPMGRFPMMRGGRFGRGRYPFMRHPFMRGGGYPQFGINFGGGQFGGGQGYPGGYQDPTQPVNNLDVPDPREDDTVPPTETGDQAEPPEGFTGPMHPPDRPPVQPDQLSPEGPAPAGGFAWGPYQRVTPEGPGTTPVQGRPLPAVPGVQPAPDYTAPQQPQQQPVTPVTPGSPEDLRQHGIGVTVVPDDPEAEIYPGGPKVKDVTPQPGQQRPAPPTEPGQQQPQQPPVTAPAPPPIAPQPAPEPHPAPASPADVPVQQPQQPPPPDHAPAPAFPSQPKPLTGRQPNGSAYPAAVTAVGGAAPSAVIIHHTGGRGDLNNVKRVLLGRGLGVQYVMDRQGNITQIGGPGSRHMMNGWGAGQGLSNHNTVGIEIIARNNADVTPQQVKAAQAFLAARYPNTPIFGHGQVNPGHKEADEGMAVVNTVRQARSGSPQYRMINDNPTWAP